MLKLADLYIDAGEGLFNERVTIISAILHILKVTKLWTNPSSH